jgi:hypothetical protein
MIHAFDHTFFEIICRTESDKILCDTTDCFLRALVSTPCPRTLETHRGGTGVDPQAVPEASLAAMCGARCHRVFLAKLALTAVAASDSGAPEVCDGPC